MLADYKISFTVGLSSKSAIRLVPYFPPQLKRVTTLRCEIQKINNSNALNESIAVVDLVYFTR